MENLTEGLLKEREGGSERTKVVEIENKKPFDLEECCNRVARIAGANEGLTGYNLPFNINSLPVEIKGLIKDSDHLKNAWRASRVKDLENQAKLKALAYDIKKVQRGESLVRDTYVRVIKNTNDELFRTNEQMKINGVTNSDLGILYRLIPFIDYQTGILVDSFTRLPFVSAREISDFLGYNGNTKTVLRALTRLVRVGVIDRYSKCYIVNYSYLLCGSINKDTVVARGEAKKGKVKRNAKRGQHIG